MENVLSDIEDTNVYIHDVDAFSSDWNHQATILNWLPKNGFTINTLKCEWAAKEIDWLLHQDLKPPKGRSMPYSTWIALATPQN